MHEHKQPIYSVDNKLVCLDCVTKEEKQGNECHHLCHVKGKDICSLCVQFHRS